MLYYLDVTALYVYIGRIKFNKIIDQFMRSFFEDIYTYRSLKIFKYLLNTYTFNKYYSEEDKLIRDAYYNHINIINAYPVVHITH